MPRSTQPPSKWKFPIDGAPFPRFPQLRIAHEWLLAKQTFYAIGKKPVNMRTFWEKVLVTGERDRDLHDHRISFGMEPVFRRGKNLARGSPGLSTLLAKFPPAWLALTWSCS
jgi:hypothetical protein